MVVPSSFVLGPGSTGNVYEGVSTRCNGVPGKNISDDFGDCAALRLNIPNACLQTDCYSRLQQRFADSRFNQENIIEIGMFVSGKFNVFVACNSIGHFKKVPAAHGDGFFRSGKASIIPHDLVNQSGAPSNMSVRSKSSTSHPALRAASAEAEPANPPPTTTIFLANMFPPFMTFSSFLFCSIEQHVESEKPASGMTILPTSSPIRIISS